MSTFLIQKPNISSFSRNENHSQRAIISPKMSLNIPPSKSQKKEDFSVENHNPSISKPQTSTPSDIRFDRVQTSDEPDTINKLEFGSYIAREALLDEEYWTVAWLRAESHWEDKPSERYIESFKRKFADQEFSALKRRCSGKHIQKCSCIIAIKKEEKNVKHTVIKSIVGSLDLNIRNLLQGQTFPGENVKSGAFSTTRPVSTQRFGYLANVCVTKCARRNGIASNMLRFAIESAKQKGVGQVFVHVNKKNIAALELYQKMGFQIVELATANSLQDENYLMRLKL